MRRALLFVFLCACSSENPGGADCGAPAQNPTGCPATFATSYANQPCSPTGLKCEYQGSASCTSQLSCTDAGTWTFSQ